MDGAAPSRRPLLIALALALLTFAVYSPAYLDDFGFINSDDTDYVTNNPHVQAGLTLDGIRWACEAIYSFNWHPLTWISLELDAELFGLDPRGYHFMNVLLHAANAVLLFWLLRRMTGAEWCSFAVAAILALHPTHVESVAWVAERKDVLSAFFWLLTTLAYVWYTERPSLVRYLPVPILFALGLTAKPMLVTLPATLLLLDFWPLRRWRIVSGKVSTGWLVLEKLPLLALVAATVPLTMKAQSYAVISIDLLPAWLRGANAVVSYVKYIGMLFWPEGLGLFYPHPKRGLPMWQVAASAVFLVAVTALVLWQWRRRPYLLVGWFWYLGTLVPVIGLMQVGAHALADRYTYVPYIGLGIMLAWGIADLTAKWAGRARPLAVAGALALIAMLVPTYRQVGYWRDSESIWSRTIAVTGPNPLAHDYLGLEMVRQGRMAEARDHLLVTERAGWASLRTHLNLGIACEALGDLDTAAREFAEALRDEPTTGRVHLLLARVEAKQGRDDKAERLYRDAQALRPSDPDPRTALGELYLGLGKLAEAQQQFEAAVAMAPDSSDACVDLGRVLTRRNKPAEAIEQFDRVLTQHADFAPAHNNKGLALEKLGRFADAAASYRRAVALEPRQWVLRCNLAYALTESGQGEAGMAQYREATRLEPEWTRLALEEAWERATNAEPRRRSGALALRAARQACQATGFRQPQALDILAAAHAELGQFDDAINWERRALGLLPANAEVREELTERLSLYESRKPYRQPASK